MYDVRCTIWGIRASAARGTEAPGGAYVRCTIYDVRLKSSRACGAGDGGGGTPPMYDVRLWGLRLLFRSRQQFTHSVVIGVPVFGIEQSVNTGVSLVVGIAATFSQACCGISIGAGEG